MYLVYSYFDLYFELSIVILYFFLYAYFVYSPKTVKGSASKKYCLVRHQVEKSVVVKTLSLLSCLSKLFEKCVLTRINTYQEFQHGTIEQVNRITSEIRNAFEKREYCTAIFLDVSQGFVEFS